MLRSSAAADYPRNPRPQGILTVGVATALLHHQYAWRLTIVGRVAYDVCVQRNITLPDGWRTRWFRRAQDHETRHFSDVPDLLGFTPARGREIWLRSGLGDRLPETVAHELDHMLRPLDVDADVDEHLASRAGQLYRLEYRERWPHAPFER